MLISFIVPVYNVEKYIEEFLDSLLNQKGDYQVILVDDGSKDASGKICDIWAEKDDRVTVLHQSNQGVLAAWINGYNISCGQYIAVLDPDDLVLSGYVDNIQKIINGYSPDMIAFGFRYLEEGKEAVEYNSNFANFDEGLYTGEKISVLKQLNFSKKKGAENNLFNYAKWNCVVKRAIAEKGVENSPAGVQMGDDVCYHLSCVYESQSIYLCNAKYYVYKIRNNSITTARQVTLSDISNIDKLMTGLKNVLDRYGYYNDESYKYELSRQCCNLVKKILTLKSFKTKYSLIKALGNLKAVKNYKIFSDGRKLNFKAAMVMALIKIVK